METDEEMRMNAQLAARQLRLIGNDQDNPYKKRAFLNAAETIESMGESIGSYFPDKFDKINGIGKSISQVLKDLFDKGLSVRVEVAKSDLEKRGLIKHKKSGDVIRRPLTEAHDITGPILEGLRLFDGVLRVELAGSIRRMKPYIADADFVVVVRDGRARADVSEWVMRKGKNGSAGDDKASAVFDSDFQIDLNFCTEQEFGCQILHSTGSKEHNIKMRAIAKSKGYKLNQRCVEEVESGKQHFFGTEEAVFVFLGMDFVPPEKRG